MIQTGPETVVQQDPNGYDNSYPFVTFFTFIFAFSGGQRSGTRNIRLSIEEVPAPCVDWIHSKCSSLMCPAFKKKPLL